MRICFKCITSNSSDHVFLILLAHVDGVDDAVALGDFTSRVCLSHIFYVFGFKSSLLRRG